MSIPILTTPPPKRTNYIIDQFEGERLTIPGSKGTFRILASSKQTNGGIAVFQSGAVLSDAPGFHWHAEAHDVFLPTKGFLKLWNGDKCRIMGPGDFAYIPPVSASLPDPSHKPSKYVEVRGSSLTSSRKSFTIPRCWDPIQSNWALLLQVTGLISSDT